MEARSPGYLGYFAGRMAGDGRAISSEAPSIPGCDQSPQEGSCGPASRCPKASRGKACRASFQVPKGLRPTSSRAPTTTAAAAAAAAIMVAAKLGLDGGGTAQLVRSLLLRHLATPPCPQLCRTLVVQLWLAMDTPPVPLRIRARIRTRHARLVLLLSLGWAGLGRRQARAPPQGSKTPPKGPPIAPSPAPDLQSHVRTRRRLLRARTRNPSALARAATRSTNGRQTRCEGRHFATAR